MVNEPERGAAGAPPRAERPSGVRALKASVAGRLSIEHKLPLFMGGLVLVVVSALAAAAYAEARVTTLAAGEERLIAVAGQLRDLFASSAAQLRGVARGMAARPELAAFVRARAPSPAAREAAVRALRYTGSQPEQVIGTELRDRAGRVILSTAAPDARPRLAGVDVAALLAWSGARDSVVIGRFRFFGDTIGYPVTAPVPGTTAHVVHWRYLSSSRRTREMMQQLIGSEASIFLGHAGLPRWSDLERPVPPPPIDTLAMLERGTQSYRRGPDGARYFAAAAAIPGTPWTVAIDFPYDAMLEPASDFLARLRLIAIAALALGLMAGYLVSRRISGPLRELTDAAVAVAAGKFSRAPDIRRADELGRLGQAFAAMASEVQTARDDLERKVELRTRDLNEALLRLHEAQDALVRREKLALLGQLASGVGHELRNPLAVMTNAVYFLKTQLHGQPGKIHEYLDIVQQQVTLSEKIVSDLLDFARAKSTQRRPVHLSDIVEAQLARLGASPGVVIDTDIPGTLPQVRVDPVQIGQVLLNLLTNAVQAIDGRGGSILVRGALAGDHVQCEVIDDGVGIARENLERIFEPLFTTRARGIGLGLAVSRQLVRANHGELTVSSSPGQGATFRIWLPVATGRVGSPDHTRHAAGVGGIGGIRGAGEVGEVGEVGGVADAGSVGSR